MRRKLVIKIGEEIRKELKQICSDESKSLFKNKSLNALESFKWSEAVSDLKRIAPLLYSLLFTLTSSTKKKIPTCCTKQEIPITFCAAILLRVYSQRANLVQRLMSVLLYASHVPKQVRT